MPLSPTARDGGLVGLASWAGVEERSYFPQLSFEFPRAPFKSDQHQSADRVHMYNLQAVSVTATSRHLSAPCVSPMGHRSARLSWLLPSSCSHSAQASSDFQHEWRLATRWASW